MKKLTAILALALLAGCGGMETSGSSAHPTNPAGYNDPFSPYYYGQG